MSQVDFNTPIIQEHINNGLKWLNMKSNSLQPFELDKIHTVIQENNGDLTVNCNLKMFGNDHPFELILSPNSNGPEFLKNHKQLN